VINNLHCDTRLFLIVNAFQNIKIKFRNKDENHKMKDLNDEENIIK